MKKHFKIKVIGKVQGVFFRASTKDKAEELGIKGIVRNEKDGSVYIEAEGEEESMNQFLAWCRKGPTHAIVNELKSEEGELVYYNSFDVKRF